jgi:hypothetical protein
MEHKYEIGQRVMWRGSWGRNAPLPATIVGMGGKNGEPVYDLNNGHWAYEDQLDAMEEDEVDVYHAWDCGEET